MPAGILALAGLASVTAGWLLAVILPGARIFTWGLLAMGGSLLAAALVIDFRRVATAVAGRRGRLGVSASVRVSLFVGIVVLANAISVGASHRFDVTGLAQFTLTSQTRKVLGDLDTPVEVIAFFADGAATPIRSFAHNLLAEYRIHSDKLTVRSVDPDVSPDLARQYGIDRAGILLGAVAFTGDAGRRVVYGPQILEAAEHAFTGALLEVTGGKQKTVYFITGHGEGGIQTEYARARDGLRDNLFRVADIDLLRSQGVPGDAAVLVLAGPRQALAEQETAMLREHLARDGRLLVLTDPDPTMDVRRLLGTWGLDVGNGHIVDPASYVVPNPDNVLVPRTRNALGLPETYFPGATALIPQPGIAPSMEVSALVWSSPESWLETRAGAAAGPAFDDGEDRTGPLAIGALVRAVPEREATAATGARLAVIGDSDFATNPHFLNGGNGALFLNAVNWLAAGQDVIAIDRKVLAIRRLLLSPEEARFLHVSSIGLLPSLLLIAAGIVWWRRRWS
jgi:ABC-type uncharacterized transport system involved in gliding motility auxiliary subunit